MPASSLLRRYDELLTHRDAADPVASLLGQFHEVDDAAIGMEAPTEETKGSEEGGPNGVSKGS